MLTFKFETAAVKRCLDEMTKKVDALGSEDMPAAFTLWQTDDMHRRYPNLDILDNKTAQTRIWPTSRLNLSKPQYATRYIGKPILRRVMFKALCERMDQLMAEKLTWR